MAKNPYQRGQLRRARQALRLSQASVAERLAELAWCRDQARIGVNADMVAKWERGEKSPSRMYQVLLCLCFDATAPELGFAPSAESDGSPMPTPADRVDVPWATILLTLGGPGQILHRHLIDEWENDLLKRRELLKSMGLTAIAATLSSLPSPVAPAARLEDRLRPDPDTLACLDELAASYQRLYHGTAPHTLITPMKAHLRTVADLLRYDCGRRERLLLLDNQGQVALLAGRLAFFDLRDPLLARGYLSLAYDSAVAASNASLGAGALGHLAFIPAGAGHLPAAVDHITRAVAYADRGASSVVRSWLAAITSEIRTNAGDHRGALTAINDAKRLGEANPSAPAPEWFDFYDASRLHGFEGYALLHSGSAGPAAHVLGRALDELAPTAVKQRTIFLTDLASANVRQGNVDEACDLAIRAATDVRTRQYATSVNRLREFRSSLRTFSSTRAVRDLDHAMATL